ncbi:MAG TPA: hypothetical protein VG605_17575 [Puia sp.]|nr:hypothetical protein [Puia sp.]
MLSIPMLFALCLPLALSAQFVTPYSPLANLRNWAIKGKALPFVLGDESGISALFGTEYGFAKNQSIGIDGFMELTSRTDDNSVDTAGITHSMARYYHGRERALFLN